MLSSGEGRPDGAISAFVREIPALNRQLTAMLSGGDERAFRPAGGKVQTRRSKVRSPNARQALDAGERCEAREWCVGLLTQHGGTRAPTGLTPDPVSRLPGRARGPAGAGAGRPVFR